MARMDYRYDVPNKKTHAQSAFTLTEIAVTIAILGVVLAIVIPNIMTSQNTTCIANRKSIQTAKQQWVVDNRQPSDVAPDKSDINGAAGYIKVEPVCPTGGAYSFRAISLTPQCSIAGHSL